MDFQESEELTLLRQSLRRLRPTFDHAHYAERARAGKKLDELWTKLAQAGLLGINVPAEYGGAGAGILELSVLCEELAAGGCPLLMTIVVFGICTSILTRHGTEAQKEKWLPRFARGETKMAFAITEPNAGSNSHRLETVATKKGNGYALRGSKCFISGADEAEAILVVARTGTDDKGRGTLSLFIVPTSARGFEMQLIPCELVSPEKQYALFFDDVALSAEHLIGAEGDGLRAVFSGLNPERITAAATGNGIALYALEKASSYANDRKVWSAPIGSHQGLAHPLAKAKIEVELARLMTTKAAWLFDNGHDAGLSANIAKYAAAEAGLAALDQAMQTHGGNGLTSEYGLADLWGVARLLRTAPVSREMILNFVSQHALGLPRSY